MELSDKDLENVSAGLSKRVSADSPACPSFRSRFGYPGTCCGNCDNFISNNCQKNLG